MWYLCLLCYFFNLVFINSSRKSVLRSKGIVYFYKSHWSSVNVVTVHICFDSRHQFHRLNMLDYESDTFINVLVKLWWSLIYLYLLLIILHKWVFPVLLWPNGILMYIWISASSSTIMSRVLKLLLLFFPVVFSRALSMLCFLNLFKMYRKCSLVPWCFKLSC